MQMVPPLFRTAAETKSDSYSYGAANDALRLQAPSKQDGGCTMGT